MWAELLCRRGYLNQFERPLDKRVSDILSAKKTQEGPVARRSWDRCAPGAHESRVRY